jgi:hypothetical protein
MIASRHLRAVLLGSAAALLAACGSGAAVPASPATTTSGSTSPAAPTTASATPAQSSASPAQSRLLTVLPESVLPELPGLEWTSLVDDAVRQRELGAAEPDASGPQQTAFLMRELTLDGQLVGGASLIRHDVALTATEARNAGIDASAGFAVKKRSKRVTVDGQQMWQATKDAQGKTPALTAVAWAEGTDLILLWATSPEDAQQLASMWLKATG